MPADRVASSRRRSVLGARRCAGCRQRRASSLISKAWVCGTTCHAADGIPPYPPDAAALHHIFPGGWIWVLRFNNGITSAGAALTDRLAADVQASEGAAAWDRLLQALPSVQEQFRLARATLPFVHAPRVAFRCREVVGEKWALLPSAAGVIDPLLSTGFPLTLLGLGRLLEILETTSAGAERQAALALYARTTQEELDVTEQLVGALYACMADPALFKRLSLLYFAAASYSETCTPPRPRASGTRIPAQRAPALWRGVARVRGARRHGAEGLRTGGALRSHRSRHRAIRYGRPPRSLATRLVSGAGRRSRRQRGETRGVSGGGRPAAGAVWIAPAARARRVVAARERAGVGPREH